MNFDFGEADEREEIDPNEILSENKVEDLVRFIRGNVIQNEQQGVLLFLGWLTGWFNEENRYVNTVVIGTSSGGKTHLVRKLKPLFLQKDIYESTSGSDKAFVDDDSWDEKRVAILSEWQKLGNEVREFMKSVAGDDGGYTYGRSVPDESGPKGARKTVTMEKDSKPYSFTYAQFSMDNEMWNRLFKNYIDEGRVINRAVARMHAGHEHITMNGAFEREYIYETHELRLALEKHIRSIPYDSHVVMPEWVFYAVEPILDLSRSEVKRSSAMVFNLIRASALLNYDSRETTTFVDDDSEEHEAYVVAPQDVANVLSCRDVLLGTTHELEPRKRDIIEAVREQSKVGEDSYALLKDIQAYFESGNSDMSKLKKDPLRELLRELDDNFIVTELERVEGNAHGYRFNSLSQIGHPRLTDLDSGKHDYSDDDPFVSVDDPSRPFKNVNDPIEGRPFHESVEQWRQKLSSGVQDSMSASSAMSGSQSDETDADDAQATLGGDVGVDTEPDGPIENALYDRLSDVDGESFAANHNEVQLEHEHLLGIAEVGEPVVEASMAGTIQDPSHELWDVDDKPDDWVTSEGEARTQVETAIQSLQNKGLVVFEQAGDKITVRVK